MRTVDQIEEQVQGEQVEKKQEEKIEMKKQMKEQGEYVEECPQVKREDEI